MVSILIWLWRLSLVLILVKTFTMIHSLEEFFGWCMIALLCIGLLLDSSQNKGKFLAP